MSLSLEQTDQFTTGSLVTRMTDDIAMIVEFMEMILQHRRVTGLSKVAESCMLLI